MDSSRDKADELFQEGRFEAALVQYDKFIKYNPKDEFALFNRGRSREETGDFDGAYDDYTKLISMRSNTKLALIARARCSFSLENFKGVVMDMNTLLKSEPSNTEGLYLRGTSLMKIGKNNQATNDLDRLVTIEPDNVDPDLEVAYFNKGVVFVFHEYWSEAIRNFTLAIDLVPEYAEAYTRRGLTKLNSSRYSLKQACDDFEKGEEYGDEAAKAGLEEYCK
jgi:tetratricopeptide (TPR) repeat protein